MHSIFVHNNGLFNVYNPDTGKVLLEKGVDYLGIKSVLDTSSELISSSLDAFEYSLNRILNTGMSCRLSQTLEDLISGNTLGSNESPLSVEEFVSKYLA